MRSIIDGKELLGPYDNEVVVLSGNIGCGKSTFAAALSRRGYVVANMDSIVAMMHGGEYGRYDAALKEVYRFIERKTITQALEASKSVVIDRTCMSEAERRRYVNMAEDWGARAVCVYWPADGGQGLFRRVIAPRGVSYKKWEAAYGAMEKRREPIRKENEGISEVFRFDDLVPKYKVVACDFDGTIVESAFPDIGSPNSQVIGHLRRLYEDLKNVIVIWTCRTGEGLLLMREWLIENEVPFDYINRNPLFETGSPKIYADLYIDDRAVSLWEVGT